MLWDNFNVIIGEPKKTRSRTQKMEMYLEKGYGYGKQQKITGLDD
jgi:hypothetical protein